MAEQLRRPGPFVPLSVLFATGKTGTAIQERFGVEGLGVWAAFLAESGKGNRGEVLFAHDKDWGAIGLASSPPKFTLKEFLDFMGRLKQTRRTHQGRALYVTCTQWERWNNAKKREQERARKSRYRAQSKRDTRWDTGVPLTGTGESADTEADTDTDSKPLAVEKRQREEQQQHPEDFLENGVGAELDEPPELEPPASEWAEPLLREMP